MSNITDFITSKITPEHVSEISSDTVALLCDALKAHLETSRPASVSIKYKIAKNRETQKHELTVSFACDEPKGAANSYKRKLSPVTLLAFADEVPGQQHIDGE